MLVRKLYNLLQSLPGDYHNNMYQESRGEQKKS